MSDLFSKNSAKSSFTVDPLMEFADEQDSTLTSITDFSIPKVELYPSADRTYFGRSQVPLRLAEKVVLLESADACSDKTEDAKVGDGLNIKTENNQKQPETASDFLSLNLKAKELSAQIDWVITHRKTAFISKLLELKQHKSVQIRRKIAKGLADIGHKKIVTEIQNWQVIESDRTTWLLLETAIDRLNRNLENVEKNNALVLTVSEAINQIKSVVSSREYTIEGELSDVRAVRQMYYFGLKDKQETKLDCTAFVGKILKAGFPLNEGLTVRATGRFRFSKFSKLQFDITQIELTGEGELLRNLLELEKKLRSEGLFDPERKRETVKWPTKVLLIASPNSAALDDFLKVTKQRRGGLDTFLLPIKTQGVGSELDIIAKLKKAHKLIDKYKIQTVVITRGGGSKDDLFVFNSEKIVREIFALPVPSIVAIGHERDTSLAELVADKRASTPSQAAEMVSLSKNEMQKIQQNYIQNISNYLQTKIEQYQTVQQKLMYNSLILTTQKLKQNQTQLNNLDGQLNQKINSLFQNIQNTYQACWQAVFNNLNLTKNTLQKTDYLTQNIQNKIFDIQKQQQISINQIQNLVLNHFKQTQHQLEISTQIIDSYNPKSVLKKGFSLVWQEGKVIEKKVDFKDKAKVKIQFVDGEKTL